MGRPLTTLTLDGTTRRLSLDGWPTGIYFVRATNPDGIETTKKLIVIKQ
jgi:hypothetical protein